MNTFTLDNVFVGLTKSFRTTITSDMVEKFVEMFGDTNPLHTDLKYALSKGFHDTVVHGMLTSAFYSTLVGIYLPGKYCILQGVDISFSKPVFVDDELTIYGNISYINEAFKQLEIKSKITNQHGVVISKAKIKTGLLDA